jgi:hypothetical protein
VVDVSIRLQSQKKKYTVTSDQKQSSRALYGLVRRLPSAYDAVRGFRDRVKRDFSNPDENARNVRPDRAKYRPKIHTK